jgi:hypothetical protein
LWLGWFWWGIAGVYIILTLRLLFHLRWARRLPASATREPALTASGQGQTVEVRRVSVVVPARNEETRVETTVRRLLAQSGVEVEVIVVDDRSGDHTGELLKRLAGEEPRLRALRVENLPAGWLGKCHACHLGALAARGEWLLFTDADCWLKPDVIARALAVAERTGADHVTLTPGVAPVGLGVQTWHLAFLLSLADWFFRVNRDRPRGYLGMGAFNLVRASAYRACGGYEALRLTVLDDVRLGWLVRQVGGRTRGFIGGDDVLCHWGSTAGAMVRVMEKNYFAAINYHFSWAAIAAVGGLLGWCGGLIGPLSGSLGGAAAGLGWLSLSLPAVVAASRLGWSPVPALLTPLVFPLLFYAILRSAVVTVLAGGVRWRDDFYPLAELRRGDCMATRPRRS